MVMAYLEHTFSLADFERWSWSNLFWSEATLQHKAAGNVPVQWLDMML